MRIGIGRSQNVLITDRKRDLHVPTLSERKIVSLLEVISADGRVLDPWMLLKGKIIQTNWDVTTLSDNVVFQVTDNAIINDETLLD